MSTIPEGYTRVSQILSLLPSVIKKNPIKFGYPMEDIDPVVLANAAARGSCVHAAIEAHIKGKMFPLTDEEQGYFESFLKWKELADPRFEALETRINHEGFKVSGCIDALVYHNGLPELCIFDWKTTYAIDAKKWPLQMAFYWLLAKQTYPELYKTAYILHLKKDGDYPHLLSYEINKELIAAATSLLNIYRYALT